MKVMYEENRTKEEVERSETEEMFNIIVEADKKHCCPASAVCFECEYALPEGPCGDLINDYTKALYKAGWRKQTEIAKQIFEDIEKQFGKSDALPDLIALVDLNLFNALKNMYTGVTETNPDDNEYKDLQV